ncbi:MAG: chemotaxis-specific protein-glutamate methyltransferase CheB [Limnobacter sp.]|nr:chemotaxis-specific protein-glutamate methyltransferase CheB [Limnobacter sp.]
MWIDSTESRSIKLTKTIRLLIVDDSALMRKLLAQIFEAEGDFEIRTARNGAEALVELGRFEPHVVTLDINMPEMDGLTALSMLMAERPTAVVMVSSLTEKGAMATFEALALGAVDFIPKPGGTISLSMDTVHDLLVTKVRAAAKAKFSNVRLKKASVSVSGSIEPKVTKSAPVRAVSPRQSILTSHETKAHEVSPVSTAKYRPFGIVAIGVSTGGPRALEEILPQFGANFPWPVLVAQHMPGTFTEAFANRLNGLCPLHVVEVCRPMPVEPGKIYIGRGGTDMVLADRLDVLTVLPKPEIPEYLWHPSVEALMKSVQKTLQPSQFLGVMLTGMGYDGAQTMAELKKAGARTIAESEETATVFGMPAELIRREGATVVLPVHEIAKQVNHWIEARGKKWDY